MGKLSMLLSPLYQRFETLLLIFKSKEHPWVKFFCFASVFSVLGNNNMDNSEKPPTQFKNAASDFSVGVEFAVWNYAPSRFYLQPQFQKQILCKI